MSCGSLHHLGEEQLKPPPLPPRRKDAMSEGKVSAAAVPVITTHICVQIKTLFTIWCCELFLSMQETGVSKMEQMFIFVMCFLGGCDDTHRLMRILVFELQFCT